MARTSAKTDVAAQDLPRPAPELAAPEAAEHGRPLVIKMPIDVRNVSLSIIAIAAAVFALRYMREVFVPIILSALIFYALDPLVDRLERLRVHRAVGAAFVLLLVACSACAVGYTLRDEAMAIVEDMPVAAQKLRTALRSNRSAEPGAIQKMQMAASEIEKTAAEAAGDTAAPAGVTRVQIEEPPLDAAGYLRWGSVGMIALVSQLVMVLFLSYFLLLSDDLYKRKLVAMVGPTLSNKKITVQILDEIGEQIQRFLLTVVFTSVIVAIVTWAALHLVGVEQAAVWGAAAGVFNSIPYFGPVIVTGGLTTIAFVQFGTVTMAVYVGFIALVITTLEGWLLTPALMGKAARMNQAAIFVGLIFWSWMWGVWGMLLAVPLMMIVKAVCDRIEDLQPIGDFLGE